MSLLSYNEICELIEQGVIEGADFRSVNSSSLDIHLAADFYFEDTNCPHTIITLKEREPFQSIHVMDTLGEGIIVEPGDFVLAASVERFNLPNHISAEYKLKSSMARIGFEHLNAGWCDAGWNKSVLTMEFKNMLRKHSIRLYPGDAIGQLVFFKHLPVPEDKSYAVRGNYNGHSTVKGIFKKDEENV